MEINKLNWNILLSFNPIQDGPDPPQIFIFLRFWFRNISWDQLTFQLDCSPAPTCQLAKSNSDLRLQCLLLVLQKKNLDFKLFWTLNSFGHNIFLRPQLFSHNSFWTQNQLDYSPSLPIKVAQLNPDMRLQRLILVLQKNFCRCCFCLGAVWTNYFENPIDWGFLETILGCFMHE